MEYISVKEASKLWKIDVSNIGKLCRSGRINGAKIVGRTWLIPKDTPRPIDGRTKKAKENQTIPDFRFPLYINFPEESFSPPLSEEEAKLRQAQVDIYACNFQKAKVMFEDLSENAENICVKICAHFFMCLLSALYDININWDKYYLGINLLLYDDFPHKKEMDLFLPWLDFILCQHGKIPEKLNCDDEYEYHTSALYLNAFLSIFNFNGKDSETINPKCTEPFVTLCRLMERDGYYIEAQELHMVLFSYNYLNHNTEALYHHLRKAVQLAYDHNLIAVVADVESYYPDEIDKILSEYPDSFAERVLNASKGIYDNFSRFAEKIQKTNVYSKLTKSDYRYVFYAKNGFTNKQVADICNLSERTIANKYNDIYCKLGVNSKQALVQKMGTAFGEKNY